jgi:hypothetical protein
VYAKRQIAVKMESAHAKATAALMGFVNAQLKNAAKNATASQNSQ